MRIGIDARFYGSLGKGLGRYTEKLIFHLEAIDTDNEYVVFLRRENFDEYIPRSPRFRKVVAQYAWYGLSEQTLFVLLLYRFRFDLVHFPHFNVPLLYRRPFVVTIHDLILVHYPTLRNTTRWAPLYWAKFLVYRLVIASAIVRARSIITVSHFTEADLLATYPLSAGKITVTYEGAELSCEWSGAEETRRLFERLSLISGTSHDILEAVVPYFLYVGNAYPHKNLEILFAVARAFPTYRLVLVGKADFFYQRLREKTEELGLTNVIFTGFLTDRELSPLYRFSRAYVFPSLYEGFGLPPLEAMSRGAVVVASEAGSLPEILGEAASYYEAKNGEALISALHRITTDRSFAEMLRERGYRQVARYSFRTMATLTLALYQAHANTKINPTDSHAPTIFS
jgi:glycosyltransferase involved in cell wall biosynthesis